MNLGERDPDDDETSFYGVGLFTSYSLMNHSCDANCKFTTFGNQIYVQTDRNVNAGEELTNNYGVTQGANRVERQKYLKENFGFICKCNLCSE